MSLIVEQRTTSDDGNAEENLNMETKVEEEGEEEYIQVMLIQYLDCFIVINI